VEVIFHQRSLAQERRGRKPAAVKTLYVICEGQTEQRFVDQVLAPHLFGCGFMQVPTIRVEFARHRRVIFREGVRKFATVRRALVDRVKDRPQAAIFFPTMVGLDALPREVPGKKGSKRNLNDPYSVVRALEDEYAKDIGDRRFVPYLQFNEYETLLFPD